jgi:plasmid stability protein
MGPSKQIPVTPVRLPTDLKEWAKTRAATNFRSLNAEIVAILSEARSSEDQRKIN